MKMEPLALIKLLTRIDCQLTINGKNLTLMAPPGVMTTELPALLRAHKLALREALKNG